MKDRIRKILLDCGAVAVGFAKAGMVSRELQTDFEDWVNKGYNGKMEYLKRHIPLRKHTDNVLAGACTVISLAFSYVPDEWLPDNEAIISCYAYGEDYHKVLREILQPAVTNLKKDYGGEWRICIDSAPVAERYWALKSGIGRKGMNGMVIVDGCGSYCFLVEILTTIEIEADSPSTKTCERCGLCLHSCPAKALKGEGLMDACKCINYLTIEYKGDFTEEEKNLVSKHPGFLYGCDICQKICPENKHSEPTILHQFRLTEKIRNLKAFDLQAMDKDEFKKLFSDSPLLYVGYDKLLRNAEALKIKRADTDFKR